MNEQKKALIVTPVQVSSSVSCPPKPPQLPENQ
jgi:hypothetical protein